MKAAQSTVYSKSSQRAPHAEISYIGRTQKERGESSMVRHRKGDNSRICNKCFKNSAQYLLWSGSTVPKLLLKFATRCI